MSAQSPRLERQRRLALSLEASCRRLSATSFHRIFPPRLSPTSWHPVARPLRPVILSGAKDLSTKRQRNSVRRDTPTRESNQSFKNLGIPPGRNYSFKTVRVCINNGSTLSFEKTPRIPKSLLAASAAVKCAVNINIGKSGIVLCITRAVSTPFITGIE
jgi:hypothetical protein